MRILLLSDIHSNLEALEACLAVAPSCDAVVNLGDIVGYNVYRGTALMRAVKKGTPAAWRDNDPEYSEPLPVEVRDIIDIHKLNDQPVSGTTFTDADVKLIKKEPERASQFFELGFQNRGKKSATYKNGTIAVDIRGPGPDATLPKKECAAILNMIVTCLRLPECSEGTIFENFAGAGLSYFNRLEAMPVFTSRNFYSVCTTICTSRSYVAKQARSILCGY